MNVNGIKLGKDEFAAYDDLDKPFEHSADGGGGDAEQRILVEARRKSGLMGAFIDEGTAQTIANSMEAAEKRRRLARRGVSMHSEFGEAIDANAHLVQTRGMLVSVASSGTPTIGGVGGQMARLLEHNSEIGKHAKRGRRSSKSAQRMANTRFAADSSSSGTIIMDHRTKVASGIGSGTVMSAANSTMVSGIVNGNTADSAGGGSELFIHANGMEDASDLQLTLTQATLRHMPRMTRTYNGKIKAGQMIIDSEESLISDLPGSAISNNYSGSHVDEFDAVEVGAAAEAAEGDSDCNPTSVLSITGKNGVGGSLGAGRGGAVSSTELIGGGINTLSLGGRTITKSSNTAATTTIPADAVAHGIDECTITDSIESDRALAIDARIKFRENSRIVQCCLMSGNPECIDAIIQSVVQIIAQVVPDLRPECLIAFRTALNTISGSWDRIIERKVAFAFMLTQLQLLQKFCVNPENFEKSTHVGNMAYTHEDPAKMHNFVYMASAIFREHTMKTNFCPRLLLKRITAAYIMA